MKHYYGVTQEGYLVVKGYRGMSSSAPAIIKETLKHESQKLKDVTYIFLVFQMSMNCPLCH